MKRTILSLYAVVMAMACCVRADTDYPIDGEVRRANRRRVEEAGKGAYWEKRPLAACAVEALSSIRRTPDLFPEDGDFKGPVRFLAARGEYEPGSFLLFAFEDLRDVQVTAGELTAKGGGRIEASEVDLTVVKVWYQAGTAWCGFHGDLLRRIPTPELMLKDETLIDVDHGRKENFIRADFRGGKTAYRWTSNLGSACNYRHFGVTPQWLHDAETLRPVSLQKNAFKQFIATLHVPVDAPPGLYRGKISVSVGGKETVAIPVEARVLPFELPRPATMRDLDREFFASVFLDGSSLGFSSRNLTRNLARHNVLHPLLPKVADKREADDLVAAIEESGLATNLLFACLPGAGLATSYPPEKNDKSYLDYLARVGEVSNALVSLRDHLGKGVLAYSYGMDEAAPKTVRAQRAMWQAVHGLGGKVMTTTRFHPYLLFNLDFALMPRQPSPLRKKEADMIHAADPDVLVGWYADPHSGPENPDFTRRLYGWVTWRNNYDLFCQYILYRWDYWSEFWVSGEPFLRGLMLCYTQDDDVIDTLAWEGVREAVDDIRYVTLLRQYARRAIEGSREMDTVYAARAAMTWVTQVDFERSSLDYLRYETIARILDLKNRLEKEGR